MLAEPYCAATADAPYCHSISVARYEHMRCPTCIKDKVEVDLFGQGIRNVKKVCRTRCAFVLMLM